MMDYKYDARVGKFHTRLTHNEGNAWMEHAFESGIELKSCLLDKQIERCVHTYHYGSNLERLMEERILLDIEIMKEFKEWAKDNVKDE